MEDSKPDHYCRHEKDFVKLEVTLNTILLHKENEEKWFERHEKIIEELQRLSTETAAFQQQLHGGYKLFLIFASILGAVATAISVNQAFKW